MNKTDGKANFLSGVIWEKQVSNTLKSIGFKYAIPSIPRSQRDRDKVDIINENEEVNGRLPYNFQCKTLAKHADYCKLLAEMPKGAEINVVIHRKTKKSEAGRFIKQGTYAIMNVDDFYDMIAELEMRKL